MPEEGGGKGGHQATGEPSRGACRLPLPGQRLRWEPYNVSLQRKVALRSLALNHSHPRKPTMLDSRGLEI